jgi:4-hydroxy-tetrahydrodipicolinate reductase
MTAVAIAGAAGRMGTASAAAIVAAPDLDLVGCFDPGHPGDDVGGLEVSADPAVFDGADVVLEWAPVDAVLARLPLHAAGARHVVVGSSGFTAERLAAAEEAWEGAGSRLLVVPNFAIGAVLMQRFAAEAARWFDASEVIELHHDAKADAPSGTSLATAVGMRGEQRRRTESVEIVEGARGADVDGVRVHSVRLPGLLAHQEVLLGNPGEVLTIRHDSMDRSSFMPGILLALRNVATLTDPVTVGLDALLH